MHYFRIILYAFFAILFLGCNKETTFLAKVPNQALSTPDNLRKLQSLLQDDQLFNRSEPYYGSISSDNYYSTQSNFNRAGTFEENLYVWASTIFYDPTIQSPDWNGPYAQVFQANTVLDNLANLSSLPSTITQYNSIKGGALFFRAKAFFNVLNEFAVPYDSVTASSKLGIPLPLHADILYKAIRLSQRICYDQVINDMKLSISLLPDSAIAITLPTKGSAYGFLSRIFLAMREYDQAYAYADSCLMKNNSLTDYNTLDTTGNSYPISNNVLVEDIFHSTEANGFIDGLSRALVDSTLFNSYESTDLRKTILYYQNYNFWSFWGTYDVIQGNSVFSGIATDEIYLIRAECEARQNDLTHAMSDINKLLVNRYQTGTYINLNLNNKDSALNFILNERRKELPFRGLRWSDLRRLNMEGRNITLTRNINGNIYTLSPNDPKYTMPIPETEISLSHIQQNPR